MKLVQLAFLSLFDKSLDLFVHRVVFLDDPRVLEDGAVGHHLLDAVHDLIQLLLTNLEIVEAAWCEYDLMNSHDGSASLRSESTTALSSVLARRALPA